MWDQLRALLITGHLLALTLSALPAPVGMKAKHLEDPLVIESLVPLHDAAAALGYQGDVHALGTRLFELGDDFLDVRKGVLRPFGPYYKLAGTRQSWRMFGTVNNKPARVELYLDDGGSGWLPLYIAREPEHAWRSAQFDQERFRAFMNDYSWKRDRRSWGWFVDWVALRAAEDFPQGKTLKALVRPRPIPPAEVLRTLEERPSGKAFWTRTVDLDEVRAEASAASEGAAQ